ncbi:adenylyl-sulfate reductase [Pelagibacteraceae bacterium]|nr:adenylyl-sulfate reductase [Pelagibacteraceae bacterium]
MITNNPFSGLTELVPPIAMQGFVLLMVGLVAISTLLDIIHKKNVKYFFNNAKKAKKSAKVQLTSGQRASVIFKTVAHDIATTAELGRGKRRIAHVLGMYGTIIFWTASVCLIFSFPTAGTETPSGLTIMWHAGAIMTCLGGFWFWLFLRVDVLAEAHPWYRIIKADLFVLALLACATFGLAWSYTQSSGMASLSYLFLVLFVASNLILFGGVYWSKFAHMFYKPGAAIQKNLAEADGSRDNLPPLADAPKQFGLGIKREQPKHY